MQIIALTEDARVIERIRRRLGVWNPKLETREKDIVAIRHLITIDNISNETSVSKPSDQCSDHDKDNNLNDLDLNKPGVLISVNPIGQTF